MNAAKNRPCGKKKTDTTPILLSATLSSRESPSKASAGHEALCVREAENQSAKFSMNYELDNWEEPQPHLWGSIWMEVSL